MKGKLLLMCSAIMVVALAAGCARQANPEVPPPAPPVPIVGVIHPQRAEMARKLELPGDVVGMYETALHAKVTGYLQSISVDKGDWVKKGQVLAVVEVPELQSNLAHAQARLVIERVTYQRIARVQKTDPRLVSQEDVDIAYARYQEAQEAVRTLQTMVGYTKIIAPFNGVITGRFADPGALIRAGGGDFGVNETSGLISPGATEGAGGHRTGGGPVLTLADIDTVRVYVYVPEQDYPFIRRGTPARLRFDEYPGEVFQGTVTRYATSLDLATRTMLAEVDVPNPDHRIYPRSYAHVTLDLERHLDALSLPTSAVQGSGRAAQVWVVHDGRLAKVAVSTGIADGNRVEITSGLSDNSMVVATYSSSLIAGQKVRPNIAPISAASADTSSGNIE